MSKLRPGTVDYSRFDNISVSDSDEEEGEKEKEVEGEWSRGADFGVGASACGGGSSSSSSSTGSKDDDDDDDEEEEEEPILSSRSIRTQNVNGAGVSTDLAALRAAWGGSDDSCRDGGETGGEVDDPPRRPAGGGGGDGGEEDRRLVRRRRCAACSAPDPPSRCSRCRSVWYCDIECQRAFHPVHRRECVDVTEHRAYWGMFDRRWGGGDGGGRGQGDGRGCGGAARPTLSSGSVAAEGRKRGREEDEEEAERRVMESLRARRLARRRRALRRAAARQMAERAREARGGGDGNDASRKGKGKKGREEEREETCAVCQCEFTVSGDSGVGLACPASHHMCAECAGVYVRSVLGDLETGYPPKCPLCRAEISKHHFDGQLTAMQQAEVRSFAASKALKPGERLIRCSRCDHFEVRSAEKENEPVVWWCVGCSVGTCLVCHKIVESPSSGGDDDRSGGRGGGGEGQKAAAFRIDHSPHGICRDLRSAKALVESAIESGGMMECPGCGLAGRKDDACTHMTCPRCATVWCYVCGLDVSRCDRAAPREGQPENDIFLHNQDWETNEARCPMYLTQIPEVDTSWLSEDWEGGNTAAADGDFEDDEKCLDHLHRFRTVRKLQEVRRRVGPGDFEAVWENFDSVKNSGYTLEEIISTDTDQLIDREEYHRDIADGEQDEDEDEEEEVDEEGEDTAQDGSDEEEWEEYDPVTFGGRAVYEEVPAEMTRASIQEEEHMRLAIAASLADNNGKDCSS